MSSFYGSTLEDYLQEMYHDLWLDEKLLAEVIPLSEPYRERIETYLDGYTEGESISWRDYSSYIYEIVPDEVWEKTESIIKDWNFHQALIAKIASELAMPYKSIEELK